MVCPFNLTNIALHISIVVNNVLLDILFRLNAFISLDILWNKITVMLSTFLSAYLDGNGYFPG